MSLILDNNSDLQQRTSKKTEPVNNNTTRALNFGNESFCMFYFCNANLGFLLVHIALGIVAKNPQA